jgi:hypothetical protein
MFVHRCERLLRSPTQISRINPATARIDNSIAILRQVKRRNDVMMHINQTALRGRQRFRENCHEAPSGRKRQRVESGSQHFPT